MTARTGGVAHGAARSSAARSSRRATSSPCCPTRPAKPRWRRPGAGHPAQDRTRRQARADRERRPAPARSRQSRIAAQGRGGRAGGGAKPSATAASCVRHGTASSPTCRPRSAAPLSRWPARRSRRSSRSIRCWRWSRCPSASSPASRSANRRRAAGTGETVTGRIRYVSKSASQPTRTYRSRSKCANADGAIPDGITAEVVVPMSPDAGDAGAALGADFFVRRRYRRAHRRRGEQGRFSAGRRSSRTSKVSCGSAASPTALASSSRARISSAKARWWRRTAVATVSDAKR